MDPDQTASEQTQTRSSLIRVFAVCYSDKNFVNVSPKAHMEQSDRGLHCLLKQLQKYTGLHSAFGNVSGKKCESADPGVASLTLAGPILSWR